jgi:hypothetical protein
MAQFRGAKRTILTLSFAGLVVPAGYTPYAHADGQQRQTPETAEGTGPSTHISHATAGKSSGAPECAPKGSGLCFVDTAFTKAVDPSDLALADWLVFASANDTLEFFANPPPGTNPRKAGIDLSGMKVGANNDKAWEYFYQPNAEAEARWLAGSPSFLRIARPSTGAYVIRGRLSGDEWKTLAFNVRINPVRTAAAFRPSGARARLVILGEEPDPRTGEETMRVAVVPLSVGLDLTHDDLLPWIVTPGNYAVLLPPDSTFRICKLPCRQPETIVLRANTTVSRSY